MEIHRTKILGFSLLLGGLMLCGIGLWLLLSHAQYQAVARIEVEPDANNSGTNISYDPYFIQTEFEVLQSQVVLGKVFEALNLNVEWGKKYDGGNTLKTSEAIVLLKRRMNLRPVRNTRLIEISVTSDDPEEAAHLANAIAQSYQDYRLSARRQLIGKGIEALQGQYQIDEGKIQVAQTNLDLLREKLKIPSNALPPPEMPPSSQDFPQRYNNMTMDLDKVVKIRETQLAYLKTLNRGRLRDVLPTVSGDRILPDLLDKLGAAERQYAGLTNNYSLTNANVILARAQMDGLNKQVDDRMDFIMADLESQLKADRAKLEVAKDQPYWDEKRRLEQMLDFHKLLAAKIEAEKLTMEIPQTMVAIVDPAVPPQTPIGSDRVTGALSLVIGLLPTVGGFLLLRSSRRQST